VLFDFYVVNWSGMELKDIDRVIIAKPVASRPICTGFRSFSELLAGAIDASPSSANLCSEMAVAAIRPKTVRVKPAVNHSIVSQVCSYSLSKMFFQLILQF